MFDLPHHIGGHSYVTWAAVVLLTGLLVHMSCIYNASLLKLCLSPQCLHFYWLILIGKVALSLLTKRGCHGHDSRSDSELSSISEEYDD